MLTSCAPRRDIARHTYFVPQLPAEIPCESLPELLALSHWRDVFVAQPRVRLNGCYIAACHYTRQGMHPDNRWVQVVHVSLLSLPGLEPHHLI